MRRRSSLLGLALAAALLAPARGVVAVDDVTPPVGSVSIVHDDRQEGLPRLIRLGVAAADDLSGVATVEVSSNGTTWASYAYAAEVDWPVLDPAAGGSTGLGYRTVSVRWIDGVGNTSAAAMTRLHLSQGAALEFPDPPVTGLPFTIRPIYPPGAILPADDRCSWELAWGNDEALVQQIPNDTYGSLFLSGRPDRGFCDEWTFTIPWVPFRQFEVFFNSPVMSGETDTSSPILPKFYPAVGSTDRRIRLSNLPLVQVLPDTYTMIVGQPITYRAHPIDVTFRASDMWGVLSPAGLLPPKYGGSKLVLTPTMPGHWLVVWNGRRTNMDFNATYDPRARRADHSRPNTTAPREKLGPGTLDGLVPVTIDWSGTDQGWGIASYKLQRSIDGGPWTTVGLPTPKSKSIVQLLQPGHRAQYRVRAIDKYGNKGAWDEGPRFRTWLVGDTHPKISYGGMWSVEPDPDALGGALHGSDSSGATASLKFEGRDVAWIARVGAAQGRAKVYVDGVLRATVDTGAATETARRIVFRWHWSQVGTHRIKVVVEGTLGRPNVTLDGFVVAK